MPSETRIINGFVIATLFGWFGSIIGLVPTQGMKGNEPLAQMLGFFTFFFVAVYAVTSGLGFIVLLSQPQGSRLWRRAVLGFVVGAGLAGLSVTVALRSTGALQVLSLSPFVFPPVAGLIAILNFPKPEE